MGGANVSAGEVSALCAFKIAFELAARQGEGGGGGTTRVP